MTECNAQLRLSFHPDLPVDLSFDAPEVSSDGGVILLRQIDERLGLTAGFAACLPDGRDPARVLHDRREQSRQRIFQIALGYADCNDADSLRWDPLLTTACDRTPQDGIGLSSQPTLSRFENAPDGCTLRQLVRFLERSYVESLPADTEVVILDIDATDDETHGAQQLSFFHGYYDHYMYHPLLVYDGDSGQLITAILRPGNTHASRAAAGVLSRLIRRIKRRFPQAGIVVRGDSGFCVPRLLERLERLQEELGEVDFLFGIAKNSVLCRQAEPTMQWVEQLQQRLGHTVKRFCVFTYAAGTWSRQRRIIAKAEHSAKGPNPRFVVTSLEEFDPETLYRAYCQRGQSENWIKDFKNAVQADRLSCSSFRANFFRLLLHLAAYRLLHALRIEVASQSAELGKAQFDTLRLRLLKVAALVCQSLRRILIRLPKAFPFATVFRDLAARLDLAPAPT
jgi:Transposase DDE domain group 1